MTQIYIKQNIHKHRTQNFQRISPFGITPVEKAHKARTCWYRGPFHRFIDTRFLKSSNRSIQCKSQNKLKDGERSLQCKKSKQTCQQFKPFEVELEFVDEMSSLIDGNET